MSFMRDTKLSIRRDRDARDDPGLVFPKIQYFMPLQAIFFNYLFGFRDQATAYIFPRENNIVNIYRHSCADRQSKRMKFVKHRTISKIGNDWTGGTARGKAPIPTDDFCQNMGNVWAAL